MFDFIPNPQAWALILGIFLPLLTAFVEQPGWTVGTRRAVSAFISVVVGALTAYFGGGLDGVTDMLTVIAIVATTSEAVYQRLWKPTGITEVVEYSTSPARRVSLPDPAQDE